MSDPDFEKVGAKPAPVPEGIYGFVHHVFENKFYQNRGEVWGPTTTDNISLFLRTKHKVKKKDIPEIIVNIQENA